MALKSSDARPLRILSSHFHGCGHHRPPRRPWTGRASTYPARWPQAVDRLSAGVTFDIHPCQASASSSSAARERVLVTESGGKAATRQLRRARRSGRAVRDIRRQTHPSRVRQRSTQNSGAATGNALGLVWLMPIYDNWSLNAMTASVTNGDAHTSALRFTLKS